MRRSSIVAGVLLSGLVSVTAWNQANGADAPASYTLKFSLFDAATQEITLQGNDSFRVTTSIGKTKYDLKGTTQLQGDKVKIKVNVGREIRKLQPDGSPEGSIETEFTEFSSTTVMAMDGKSDTLGGASAKILSKEPLTFEYEEPVTLSIQPAELSPDEGTLRPGSRPRR